MNLANYFPVLLFILVGIGVGLVPMFLGKILAPSKPDAEKLSPYECGFEAFEDARMKFDVRYYLIAILFIKIMTSLCVVCLHKLIYFSCSGSSERWKLDEIMGLMRYLTAHPQYLLL